MGWRQEARTSADFPRKPWRSFRCTLETCFGDCACGPFSSPDSRIIPHVTLRLRDESRTSAPAGSYLRVFIFRMCERTANACDASYQGIFFLLGAPRKKKKKKKKKKS